VFLLVPAHPGSPEERAVKQLLLLLYSNKKLAVTDGLCSMSLGAGCTDST